MPSVAEAHPLFHPGRAQGFAPRPELAVRVASTHVPAPQPNSGSAPRGGGLSEIDPRAYSPLPMAALAQYRSAA
jgi:hypothetical protein